MLDTLVTLASLGKGQRGLIEQIDESRLPHNVELESGELERRLLEIGLIEGSEVTVLHFGLINRDPIALKIGDGAITIAIRRNEAEIILVRPIENKHV